MKVTYEQYLNVREEVSEEAANLATEGVDSGMDPDETMERWREITDLVGEYLTIALEHVHDADDDDEVQEPSELKNQCAEVLEIVADTFGELVEWIITSKAAGE